MAKNLASVKPVKVWGFTADGKLLPAAHPLGGKDYSAPCTLLTTARYKKLMDVVKAAQKRDRYPGVRLADTDVALEAAIEAAEKAGAL